MLQLSRAFIFYYRVYHSESKSYSLILLKEIIFLIVKQKFIMLLYNFLRFYIIKCKKKKISDFHRVVDLIEPQVFNYFIRVVSKKDNLK